MLPADTLGVPGGEGTVALPVAVPDCLELIEPFVDEEYPDVAPYLDVTVA